MTVEFVSAKLKEVSNKIFLIYEVFSVKPPVARILELPCGGSNKLIKTGKFGWKIELEKLKKMLTVAVNAGLKKSTSTRRIFRARDLFCERDWTRVKKGRAKIKDNMHF